MKMFYGNTPVNSMRVIKHDVSTNDATMKASDLQAGITAYAKGKKVTGTGKSFEFANYGQLTTNSSRFIPSNINIIEIGSTQYPIKLSLELLSMKDVDFLGEHKVGTVVVNGNEHDLIVSVESNIMKIKCDETIRLEIFYGKDNYA